MPSRRNVFGCCTGARAVDLELFKVVRLLGIPPALRVGERVRVRRRRACRRVRHLLWLLRPRLLFFLIDRPSSPSSTVRCCLLDASHCVVSPRLLTTFLRADTTRTRIVSVIAVGSRRIRLRVGGSRRRCIFGRTGGKIHALVGPASTSAPSYQSLHNLTMLTYSPPSIFAPALLVAAIQPRMRASLPRQSFFGHTAKKASGMRCDMPRGQMYISWNPSQA